jgi:predicted transcriptional regulator of viral defense system
MKVWKIQQYLPDLLLYVRRRVEGGRGFLVAIRIVDICGVDRRCCTVVQALLARLEERGLARRHKQGVYLIERGAAEEVIAALRQWIERL